MNNNFARLASYLNSRNWESIATFVTPTLHHILVDVLACWMEIQKSDTNARRQLESQMVLTLTLTCILQLGSGVNLVCVVRLIDLLNFFDCVPISKVTLPATNISRQGFPGDSSPPINFVNSSVSNYT